MGNILWRLCSACLHSTPPLQLCSTFLLGLTNCARHFIPHASTTVHIHSPTPTATGTHDVRVEATWCQYNLRTGSASCSRAHSWHTTQQYRSRHTGDANTFVSTVSHTRTYTNTHTHTHIHMTGQDTAHTCNASAGRPNCVNTNSLKSSSWTQVGWTPSMPVTVVSKAAGAALRTLQSSRDEVQSPPLTLWKPAERNSAQIRSRCSSSYTPSEVGPR